MVFSPYRTSEVAAPRCCFPSHAAILCNADKRPLVPVASRIALRDCELLDKITPCFLQHKGAEALHAAGKRSLVPGLWTVRWRALQDERACCTPIAAMASFQKRSSRLLFRWKNTFKEDDN